ncbi:MAG: peroxiredoxin-like family protein [Thiogranum sp.]|nr:peroxiredoxin-like family protein [Thiogranum sp.]
MNRALRKIICTCLLSLLPVAALQADQAPPVPNLGDRISDFKAQRPAPAASQRAVMDRAAKDLAAAMPAPGLEAGTTAPDFTLPDSTGNAVQLAELLKQGPVVLIFYRGAWCPYCNMQLQALKESMPHFERHGAQLVAVTPQTPDRSQQQIEKDAYPFTILSDLDDQVMKAYNLYFEVPEELRHLYLQDFDLDIAAYNGKDRYGLPVPGTFIIDRQGVIRAAHADTDYTTRMEPAAIIEALGRISGNR